MKLIPLIILTISLAVDSKAHEHFTFPPQFQMPHSSMFTSEKNPYLPPEAHTPLPYFQMNNINKLPFPYLPPTATKAPSGYPTPFPMMFSSSLRPKIGDDDDDDEDEKSTTPLPPHLRSAFNRTQRMPNQMAERREMRPIPKSFQHPIDRIDTKMQFQYNASPDSSTPSGAMQTMSPRSIIISDIQRDHNMEQMKAASFQNPQYVPQPGIFISSTTETAIPILRLSNEMDLDGSFSYEALGADQTHYVQHSRMENMGAGKDEQVVEGSYSYVGDNGKTYTVHYIADSNGFRASGDHLPVAPPIPEIIQRAIQYNLAEESKKPPHLKSWNGEEQENELSESEKRHQFAVSPPRLSSLFTGKTPESFSHSFSQPSNTQNNLVAAASSQSPVQTSIDFADQMQHKQNSGTISPQITFLASQGAHVPSANTPQQSISRVFTTEKSTMPQLINYEANMKEPDQENNNKALWRWQYGINANTNQNGMEKQSISRSFGADDIVINFSDMTPEQYTKMIKQQLEPNMSENPPQKVENSFTKQKRYYNDYNINAGNNYQLNNDNLTPENAVASLNSQYSTENTTPLSYSDDSYINQYESNKNYLPNYDDNSKQFQNEGSQTSRPKLITQQQFIPLSQTVTQNYNYDQENFESRKTKILNSDTSNFNDIHLNVIPLNYEKKNLQYNIKSKINEDKNESNAIVTQEPPKTTILSTDLSTMSNHFKFSDFIVSDDKDNFKPVFRFTEPHPEETTTTTTEASIANVFEENIFLKNLFTNDKNYHESNNNLREEIKNSFKNDINGHETNNKLREENKNPFRKDKNDHESYNNLREENKLPFKNDGNDHGMINKLREEIKNKVNLQVKPIDTRTDKHPKFLQYQSKPHNDIKVTKKKQAIDIAEVLNYISRNQFESNKLKLAPKQVPDNYYKQKNEIHYYSPEDDSDNIEENNMRNYRTLQQQGELSGVIKNYKVLHRNNNYANVQQDDVDELRRNLSPPPLKSVNLPPLGRAGPSMKSYLPPIYV